jgi:tRNA-Thr(GGU) m(6)t(6)A37 methyltransferase TsaA
MNVLPIGIVNNGIVQATDDQWMTIVSDIVINKELEPALDQIEKYSHVIVIYWIHKIPSAAVTELKIHPKKRVDLPLVGILATRSPSRPNPIGLKTVKIIEHKSNILKVIGLDAIDGTPVLDIKPYIPGYDSPVKASVPDWHSNNSAQLS